MLDRLRAHRPLLAVVTASYVALIAVGALTGNSQTLFYAVLIPALMWLATYLDARNPFSSFVLGGLALWAVLHMAGGLVPATEDRVLYNVWLLPFVRFDHLVHAVGFGFAGLAFREAVRPSLNDTASGAAIVLMGGVGIGGLNEMFEFLISKVIPDTNIGGFDNTGWDLVANLVGASVAAFWVHRSWAVTNDGRSAQSRRANTLGRMTPPTVLFMCVHNAGRSQMAAGFMRHLGGDGVRVFSGGSEPAESVNQAAVDAMAEAGIDIAGEQPQLWSDSDVEAADVVVSMGCGDVCPVYPGKRYLDWELDDPAGRSTEGVRPIRDDILQRVMGLMEDLGVPAVGTLD